MPTPTFYNLPKDKRNKFLKAAADEFSKKPYEEVSINQIIRTADIPRGSFYAYFSGKEELITYLFEDYFIAIKQKIQELENSENGNIFNIFILLFKYILENYIYIENRHFMYNIITSTNFMKNDDSCFSIKNVINTKVISNINRDILNIQNDEDITYLIDILMAVLKHSLIEACAKNETSKESCEKFRKKIELIQKGLRKEGI